MANLKFISKENVENALLDLGIDIIENNTTLISFWFNQEKVTYYYKKQWFTGKTVVDGRGLDNLLKQLNK